MSTRHALTRVSTAILLMVLYGALGNVEAKDVQYGPWEKVRAEYLVAPVPLASDQRTQPVVLRLVDGSQYLRALNPIPKEYGFVGHWVEVEGRRVLGAPPLEGVFGVPFEVDSIKPVSGGVHPSIPRGGLPAPPLLEGVGQSAGLAGRWVMVLGALERLTPRGAVLRTRAGESLVLSSIPEVHRETIWMPLLGEDVTSVVRFMGRGVRIDEAHGVALCAGQAPRCGMLPGQAQGGSSRRPARPGGVTQPRAPVRSGGGSGSRGPQRPKRPSPYYRGSR